MLTQPLCKQLLNKKKLTMLASNYWIRRQQDYLAVVKASLPLFQEKVASCSLVNEDAISRELYFSIHEVVFRPEFVSKELGLPTFQANNQPKPTSKFKLKAEDKRPDFLWSYIDYINKSRRDFHIECKRLRENKTTYCREYVYNGLNRFLYKEWSYGDGCHMGLMVGYVESVSIYSCVEKISEYLMNESISPFNDVSGIDVNSKLAFLKHTITRPNIAESPFDLHHYFVVIVN